MDPRGVFRISNDGDDRMGAKVQDPKKSLRFQTRSKKISELKINPKKPQAKFLTLKVLNIKTLEIESGSYSFSIIHCFHYLRLRRNVRACNPRRMWVLPRPQLWFQQLLNDRVLDHWWKENFRVSRARFEYICQLVGPALRRQDTHMRDAIPIEKRVGASLWRLATGACYRSFGLMIGLSKSAVNCCDESVQELCRLKDN